MRTTRRPLRGTEVTGAPSKPAASKAAKKTPAVSSEPGHSPASSTPAPCARESRPSGATPPNLLVLTDSRTGLTARASLLPIVREQDRTIMKGTTARRSCCRMCVARLRLPWPSRSLARNTPMLCAGAAMLTSDLAHWSGRLPTTGMPQWIFSTAIMSDPRTPMAGRHATQV